MNNLYYHSRPDKVRVSIAAVVDGQNVKFGVSRCSTQDQFVKRTGRKIALERATTTPYLEIQLAESTPLSLAFIVLAKGIATHVKEDSRRLKATKLQEI